MHETTLVRSLLQQVERLASEHGGGSVTQIEVEIGPLSGVEPLFVRRAFDLLVEHSSCSGAELVIHEVALQASCRTCGAEFAVERFRFLCAKCSSQSVRVTQGDEFRLLKVTLEIAGQMESSA